jgi:hypothetical protein
VEKIAMSVSIFVVPNEQGSILKIMWIMNICPSTSVSFGH